MRSFEEFYTEMEQRPGIGGAVAPGSMGTMPKVHDELTQQKIAYYMSPQGGSMSQADAEARVIAELGSGMQPQQRPGMDVNKVMQGIQR